MSKITKAIIWSLQSLAVRFNEAMMACGDITFPLKQRRRKWRMTHPPDHVRRDWRKSQDHNNYRKNNIWLIFDEDNTLPLWEVLWAISVDTISTDHSLNGVSWSSTMMQPWAGIQHLMWNCHCIFSHCFICISPLPIHPYNTKTLNEGRIEGAHFLKYSHWHLKLN